MLGNWRRISALPVAMLVAGAVAACTTVAPSGPSVGPSRPYKVRVVVDPANSVDELDETDNEAKPT